MVPSSAVATHFHFESAALGIVLGAAYMLWLYRRVFFGVADKQDVKAMPDLTGREAMMFAPLLLLVLLIGLAPASVQHVYKPALSALALSAPQGETP